MNRPGPVGFGILLAFALVIVVELRTVLTMLGIDVPATVYFPAAALIVALVVGGLLLLPREDDPGNPSEA